MTYNTTNTIRMRVFVYMNYLSLPDRTQIPGGNRVIQSNSWSCGKFRSDHFQEFTPTGAGALWPLCHKYGDFA